MCPTNPQISGLKRQLREQRELVRVKDGELQGLRATQKLSHIEDLEAEVTAYYEEALRLQTVGQWRFHCKYAHALLSAPDTAAAGCGD